MCVCVRIFFTRLTMCAQRSIVLLFWVPRGNAIFSYISEAPMDFRWNRDNITAQRYLCTRYKRRDVFRKHRQRDTTFFVVKPRKYIICTRIKRDVQIQRVFVAPHKIYHSVYIIQCTRDIVF